jgi:hypothetical protein
LDTGEKELLILDCRLLIEDCRLLTEDRRLLIADRHAFQSAISNRQSALPAKHDEPHRDPGNLRHMSGSA